MKQHIKELLSEALPAVDFDSDFLFTELDSLGVVTVLVLLENEYKIPMDSSDARPKNLKNLDAIVKMVETKLAAKK